MSNKTGTDNKEKTSFCKAFQRLYFVESISIDYKDLSYKLTILSSNVARALNYCMTELWLNERGRNEFHELHGRYPKPNEVVPIESRLYRELRLTYPEISTRTITCVSREAKLKWSAVKKETYYLQNKSLPTYRSNTPILLHNQQYDLTIGKDGQLYLLVTLYSKKPEEKIKRFKIRLITKGFTKSQRAILHRILSGEYKKGAGKIMKDRRKNQWFLIVAYTFEPEPPQKHLDFDSIVGLHLGFKNAFYCAVSNGKDRIYASGQEITNVRNQIRNRRRSIQNQSKTSKRRGNGRNKVLRPTEALREKEKNYRDTIYHQFSRRIIDFALKHNAGTIQMEDLDTLKRKKQQGKVGKFHPILLTWAISDLQTKLEYKAKEAGINIKYVKPEYDSQRCFKCGHIYEENRAFDRDLFVCVNCGMRRNADYNAALNLTMPDLEEVIKKRTKIGNLGETPNKKAAVKAVKKLRESIKKKEVGE